MSVKANFIVDWAELCEASQIIHNTEVVEYVQVSFDDAVKMTAFAMWCGFHGLDTSMIQGEISGRQYITIWIGGVK